MNTWLAFDTWSGFPVFLDVFWKSGVVLGATLCATALLQRKSADLRRLALSASVVVLFLAAALQPSLPRLTLRVRSSVAAIGEQSPAVAPLGEATPALSALMPAAPASAHSQVQTAGGWIKHVPLLLVTWFAGALFLLVRFLIGLRKLRQFRIASEALSDYELVADRRVSLLRNESIDAPVTWGIVRPVILVPEQFEQLPAECRSQVLCHELAHIQNYDFCMRMVMEIARALLWFQPLIWITRRQLREEQELACDDRVLATGGRPSSYARLLLDWDRGLRERDSLIAVGMAQRSCLKRRLCALLDLDTSRGAASRAAIAATWSLALAMALPLAAVTFAPAASAIRRPSVSTPVTAATQQPIPSVSAPPAAPLVAAARVAPDDQPAPEVPDSQVVFEVASVKHGPPNDYSASGNGGGPGTAKPTRWSVENYPMSSLLDIAYGVSTYQLSGPSWLDEERFTVDAKVPEGASKDQLKLMVRNLLIERFQLAAHLEKKDVAGYQLVVAKGGSKLAQSAGDAALNEAEAKAAADFKWTRDNEGYPELPPGRHSSMAMGYGRARWRFADEAMDHFAGALGEQIHQPIVNATGLTGKYDFVFAWSYAAMQPNAPADAGPTIFAAIQEQLGLKLESKKVPVDVVVIDHIEKTPREN